MSMKFVASAKALYLVIPILLALQLTSWFIFDNTLSLFITLLMLQVSVGAIVLWLAFRQQRLSSKLERKIELLAKPDEVEASKSASELTRLVELNTEAVRRITQVSLKKETTPRELHAFDTLEIVRDEMEVIRRELKVLRSQQTSRFHKSPDH